MTADCVANTPLFIGFFGSLKFETFTPEPAGSAYRHSPSGVMLTKLAANIDVVP